MSPVYKNLIRLSFAILLVFLFVVVMSSVIGLLLTALLVFCVKDLTDRRRRNTAKSLNSAIRAVSRHDGSIAKIAAAFSRRGPLSGPCYEFARRLLMGEPAVQAAAMSHVPLQLSTAVAIESPSSDSDDDEKPATHHLNGVALPDWNTMPVYAQLLYLSLTVLFTFVVFTFITAYILPTFQVLFAEFGYDSPHVWWSFSSNGISPSWMLVPAVLLMLAVPIWSHGHIFGLRLPRWLPSMPRVAEQQADTLLGLADAIDAGWPVRRALEVGNSLSTSYMQRKAMYGAMVMIDQGMEPAAALKRAGWIDAREAAWLTGASPQRTADLLRTIADQNVRDATANLRWMMAIVFPIVVLMLGITVLVYAADLFRLMTVIIA